MIFTAFDPMDGEQEAMLRHVCLASVKRVSKAQASWMKLSESRPHLAELSIEDRRAHFGLLLVGAIVLARNEMIPSPDPKGLLGSISSEARKASPVYKMKSSLCDDRKYQKHEKALIAAENMLAIIPGFDRGLAEAGEPQSEEFMAEFRLDFPYIREMSFEMRKPFQFALNSEGDIAKKSAILKSADEACFTGIDTIRIETLLDAKKEPEPELSV